MPRELNPFKNKTIQESETLLWRCKLLMCFFIVLPLQIFLPNLASASEEISPDECPWKTYSDLLIKNKNELTGGADTLTSAQMAVDLNCLSKIYQYQYIGSYYPSRHDLSQTIKSLKKQLPASMSSSDFMDLIIQSHISIYDNHFSVSYKTKHYSYYRGMPQYQIYRLKPYFIKKNNQKNFLIENHKKEDLIKECNGFSPYPTLTEDRFIFIKLSLEDINSASCRTKNNDRVRIKVEKLTQKNDNLSSNLKYHDIDKNLLYIRIPYADMGQSEIEKKLLSELSKDSFQKDLIIDLRDNHGGSSLFGKMLLSSLMKDTDKINFPQTISVDSVYNIAALINMCRIISYENSNALIKKLLTQYERRLLRHHTSLSDSDNKNIEFLEESSASQYLPWPTHGMRKTPYYGKIVLLINRACASSCEDLVSDLKKFENTILIGTHTGGFFNYNDVGTLILPESKIQVHTTTSTNMGHQEITDGIGFAPDFYDSGNRQLEKAIRYLRKYTTRG